MKKLLLTIAILLLCFNTVISTLFLSEYKISFNSDSNLIDEIKKCSWYSGKTSASIESYVNDNAGLDGNVVWELKRDDSIANPNIIILEARYKIQGVDKEELDDWVYNTNTKKVAVWNMIIDDKEIFRRGVNVYKE